MENRRYTLEKERDALELKIKKLSRFLDTKSTYRVAIEHERLLMQQETAMKTYLLTLNERIKLIDEGVEFYE